MIAKRSDAELGDALGRAIDQDAYNWLSKTAPGYLEAIELELNSGFTPAEIRWFISSRVGEDRQGIAIRCEQAARYILSAKE